MFQGHAGLTFAENMSVGFGGVLARFKQDESITTYGISVDAHLPFHQYIAMKGEFGYGNNFNNANIFTIGGSAHNNETDVTNIGFWINAVSKPLDHLHLVGGIGLETVSSDLDDGDKESNFTAYGDVIIPVAGTFSVALEYQFLQTTMKGDDPIMANIVDISCKVVF